MIDVYLFLKAIQILDYQNFVESLIFLFDF